MRVKVTVGAIKSEILSNQRLVDEIHKPVTKRFKRRKVISSFRNKTWGADLSYMKLKVNTINKFDIYYV